MVCFKCRATNPEDKKYCGDCGSPLDSTIGPILTYLELNLRPQVQSILKDQFKDQRVIETEIAEAIVSKLSNWAKLFGYAVGIPIGLLIIVLSILGIKTYSDFSSLVNAGKEELTRKLDAAQQQAQAITAKGEGLSVEYQKLETRLGQFKALDEKVGSLETAVGQIAPKVGVEFVPSAALTPDLKRSLESSVASYIAYLQRIGFKPEGRRVTVDIDPKLNNTYYSAETNRIVLGLSEAKDKNVVLATYTYHVLRSSRSDLYASNNAYVSSLFIAFGDYFACSFTKNPVLGENIGLRQPRPYIRNLDNKRSFSEITPRTPQHDAAEVWAGAFWEIRQTSGPEIADKILFSTWVSIGPSTVLNEYAKAILKVAEATENGRHVDGIRSVFSRRGMSL